MRSTSALRTGCEESSTPFQGAPLSFEYIPARLRRARILYSVTLHKIKAVRNFAFLCFLSFSYTAFAFSGSELADSAMRKDTQSVRTLLKQNADPNAPQSDGTTALHWAARWDDVDIAAALIRAGANPQAVNRDGATPMFLATLNGSAAMIDTLLKAGADVNAPVLSRGETALMMAARTGRLDPM